MAWPYSATESTREERQAVLSAAPAHCVRKNRRKPTLELGGSLNGESCAAQDHALTAHPFAERVAYALDARAMIARYDGGRHSRRSDGGEVGPCFAKPASRRRVVRLQDVGMLRGKGREVQKALAKIRIGIRSPAVREMHQAHDLRTILRNEPGRQLDQGQRGTRWAPATVAPTPP